MAQKEKAENRNRRLDPRQNRPGYRYPFLPGLFADKIPVYMRRTARFTETVQRGDAQIGVS